MSFIVLVPVEIDTFAGELYEIATRIKESDFHIMREDKYASEYVIVVIIPNVFIGERNHRFL